MFVPWLDCELVIVVLYFLELSFHADFGNFSSE